MNNDYLRLINKLEKEGLTYNYKVRKAGDYLKVEKLDVPKEKTKLAIGKPRQSKKHTDTKTKNENDINKLLNGRLKQFNIKRDYLVDLIKENMTTKDYFITLTFKNEITSIKQANYEFNKYIKRLKYNHNKEIKYINVPEIQKERQQKTGKNVIHFHTIFFNFDRINANKLRNIWSLGRIHIAKIRHQNDAVAKYITKYLTKQLDFERGTKSFYKSRNLKEPELYYDNMIKENLHQYEIQEQGEYRDKFGRLVKYTNYKKRVDNK